MHIFTFFHAYVSILKPCISIKSKIYVSSHKLASKKTLYCIRGLLNTRPKYEPILVDIRNVVYECNHVGFFLS